MKNETKTMATAVEAAVIDTVQCKDEQVTAWLADLEATDLSTRRQARLGLTGCGEAVLPRLIDGLLNGPFPVRWELAKALGDMRLTASAGALVAALEDEEPDVRWLAAVALAHIGRTGVVSVLTALIDRPESPYLRQGAHHVLAVYGETRHDATLSAVRDALGPLENDADAIPAAAEALRDLKA